MELTKTAPRDTWLLVKVAFDEIINKYALNATPIYQASYVNDDVTTTDIALGNIDTLAITDVNNISLAEISIVDKNVAGYYPATEQPALFNYFKNYYNNVFNLPLVFPTNSVPVTN